MQLSGQYDNVESTALAKEDRADNSDVPKIQRESIRTRRERLHGDQIVVTAHAAREKLTGSTAASTMPLPSEPHVRASAQRFHSASSKSMWQSSFRFARSKTGLVSLFQSRNEPEGTV